MAEKIYYSSQRDIDDTQGEILEDIAYDEDLKWDEELLKKLMKLDLERIKNG